MNTLDFLNAHGYKSKEDFLSMAQYLKDNWAWMKYSYAIAIKVRRRMTELGWTQKQLANALECTQQHVSILLNGRVNMTLETVAKLEAALDFDIIGKSLDSFSYPAPVQTNQHYLNSTGDNEKKPDINTSTLVDGYKPRKKKGPGKKQQL